MKSLEKVSSPEIVKFSSISISLLEVGPIYPTFKSAPPNFIEAFPPSPSSAKTGSLVGSLISYYIGVFGANTFIPKYGKYFLLNNDHLAWTHKWFEKNGSKTVFFSRFIPVVRHLISIPAGIAKMNLKKFILYSFVGASIWNMFLVYIGFKLNKNWGLLHKYSRELDIIVIVFILAFVTYHIINHFKKKHSPI